MPIDAVLAWQGPSEYDGKPILVVATNVSGRRHELNRKTGDVVGTWIIRADIPPFQALKERGDASVCGTCPLRPQGAPGTLENRACYVHPGMVDNIWQAYDLGGYPGIHTLDDPPFAGRVVRLGSYGDPAAVPAWVLRHLLKGTRGHVGYTHAWRTRPDLRDILMASVDTPQDLAEARAAGWRTFRTRLATDELVEGEIVCPASAEGGKRTTCERCQLCDGARGADRRRSLAIVAHGFPPNVVAYERLRGAARAARRSRPAAARPPRPQAAQPAARRVEEVVMEHRDPMAELAEVLEALALTARPRSPA